MKELFTVGEIITFEKANVILEVCEYTPTWDDPCGDCYLKKSVLCQYNHCSSFSRDDRKNVIFKYVGKFKED